MRLSLLALVAVLALTGCNTARQGTYEKITVRTPGVDNAYCDLYTDNNRYRVMTSRQVLVERSDQPITVICKKTGYYTASVIVDPELSAPGLPMNLATGLVPGTLYDIASNSIYNYPDTVTVILLPMPPQELPPEPASTLMLKTPEPVKPAPVSTAPPPEAADKSMSKSLRK